MGADTTTGDGEVTPPGDAAQPESGHRSERRLRDAVKNAAIGVLAADDADRERLGEIFEIVGDYEGRSPFSAASDAYRRGDDEAVARALADERRLDSLTGAGR